MSVDGSNQVAAKRMPNRSAQSAAPTALKPEQSWNAEREMSFQSRTPYSQSDQGNRPRPRFERDKGKGGKDLIEYADHRAWGTQG